MLSPLLILALLALGLNAQTTCDLAAALPTDCHMTADCLGFNCATTIPGTSIAMEFDVHFQACTLPNTLDLHIAVDSFVIDKSFETNADSQFRFETPASFSLLGETVALYVIIKNVGFPQPTVFHADFSLQGCASGIISSCSTLGSDPIYSLNVNAGQDPCTSADSAALNATWAGVGTSLGVLGLGAVLFCFVSRRKATKNGTVIAEPPLCGRSLKPQWLLLIVLFLFVLICSAWYVYPWEVATKASDQLDYTGKDIYNALIVAMVFWSITMAITLYWTHAYRTSANGWVLLLRFLVWLFVFMVFFVSLIVACLWGANKINDITLADHTKNIAILSWVCCFIVFVHHLFTLGTDDTHANWDKTRTHCGSGGARCAACCAGASCACCKPRGEGVPSSKSPRSMPI